MNVQTSPVTGLWIVLSFMVSTMYYTRVTGLGQRPKNDSGGTAQRILEHARRAFNERGVAAVGIREIARDLEMSPGNLSYHFATKDALVAALIEQLHAENNALVAAPSGPLDFAMLDTMLRTVMKRDLDNQWFKRDCVAFILTMPSLLPLLEPMHEARHARVDTITARLIEAGLLDRDRTKAALPHLRVQLVTQIAFWVPSALLAAPKRDPAKSLDLHARAALALFLPYCTPSGKRQLQRALDR
jgi:AcrR family transcriptional regulator